MSTVSKFVKDHIPLCVCTLSIAAALGYLGYYRAQWIIDKCDKTEKIDHVAQKALLPLSQDIPATTIQSIWRSYRTRVKVKKESKHYLLYALLEKAKPYLDDPYKLQYLPQALSGHTPVYLPSELPIVLKRCGFPKNQKRFDKMRQARNLCEINGYKHLVIPKARVYKNFIVESRLPISVHRTKEQIGFYIENRERFADVVKEFTGFLCQSNIEDITGGNCNPFITLSNAPLGRYDNIALYLEGNQGKIGLIDLERFSPECSRGVGWCFSKCKDAIDLFPYHFDEIMSVAKKFDPYIEIHHQKLQLERDEALKRFKLTYEDHVKFIKEKGITIANPSEIVKITNVRKESIKEAMIAIIRNENEEESKKFIALFEKSFPKILDLITDFLSEMINLKINSVKEPILFDYQLVSCRTLHFDISHKRYEALQKNVASNLDMMKIEGGEHEEAEAIFVSLIIQCVFKELATGQEIAYYNPRFGIGSYAKQCIFC